VWELGVNCVWVFVLCVQYHGVQMVVGTYGNLFVGTNTTPTNINVSLIRVTFNYL
jgi:hypothetical protein